MLINPEKVPMNIAFFKRKAKRLEQNLQSYISVTGVKQMRMSMAFKLFIDFYVFWGEKINIRLMKYNIFSKIGGLILSITTLRGRSVGVQSVDKHTRQNVVGWEGEEVHVHVWLSLVVAALDVCRSPEHNTHLF